MKKNYNYAYTCLQESKEYTKRLLAFDPDILSVINDSKLTQESLDSLDKALNLIEVYTKNDDGKKLKIDSSLPQHRQYITYLTQYQKNYPSESPLPEQKLRYLVAERTLERYRDDFGQLLVDVFGELRKLCSQGDNDNLTKLLSVSPWIENVLPERHNELGILAAMTGRTKILEVIYPVVKDQDNEQKILSAAVKYDNIACIEYLLANGADPLPLLGTDNYYNNESVVNLLTEHLYKKEEYVFSNYYKGMFLYKGQRYKEAVEVFQKVIDCKPNDDTSSGLVICSLLYQGYCNQYLKEYGEAKKIFQKVKDYESSYYDIVNIKNKAKKHLNEVESIVFKLQEKDTKQKEISTLLEKVLQDDILHHKFPENFIQKVTEFCNSLEIKDSHTITELYKELQQTFVEVKHVKIRQVLSENVLLASKFEDIKEIHGSFVLTDKDKQAYEAYKKAVDIIDNAQMLIGDISQGMVIEDY